MYHYSLNVVISPEIYNNIKYSLGASYLQFINIILPIYTGAFIGYREKSMYYKYKKSYSLYKKEKGHATYYNTDN